MRRVMPTIVFVLLAGCAAKPEAKSSPEVPGGTFRIVNGSPCTARIVLHDIHGRVVTNIKFPDLPPGRTEQVRVPHPNVTLDVVGIDALGNACSPAQTRKIQITRVQ